MGDVRVPTRPLGLGLWSFRLLCAHARLRVNLCAALGDAVADRLFGDIQTLVWRTLLAVHRVITQDRHCFELYGYEPPWPSPTEREESNLVGQSGISVAGANVL